MVGFADFPLSLRKWWIASSSLHLLASRAIRSSYLVDPTLVLSMMRCELCQDMDDLYHEFGGSSHNS